MEFAVGRHFCEFPNLVFVSPSHKQIEINGQHDHAHYQGGKSAIVMPILWSKNKVPAIPPIKISGRNTLQVVNTELNMGVKRSRFLLPRHSPHFELRLFLQDIVYHDDRIIHYHTYTQYQT